ncbi:MAG: hypothetical protein A2Y38_03360 [Spirochaetes bacterium GWB1_59_5]|nr:MAG: hypothetical protein A2Y38_03360 [Spirochaetes bacterium GWB1_59_5]
MASTILEVKLGTEELQEGIAETYKLLEISSEIIEVFHPMVNSRREGRHITKLCSGLNDSHMKALDRLFVMGGE